MPVTVNHDDFLPGQRRRPGVTLQDYDAPFMSALGAGAEEAWARSPSSSLWRMAELDQEFGAPAPGMISETGIHDRLAPETPVLSVDEANERGKPFGLTFDEAMPKGAVDLLIERKRAEVARQDLVARAPGGIATGAAMIATDLLVSAMDPLNVASAFIPVVREARFASWAARYGSTRARLARGTVEGLAGAAVVEPIVLAAADQEQADYGLSDSFLNIALGGVLGGGLHVAGGKISDALRRRAGQLTLDEAIARLPVESREALMRGSLAQEVQGRRAEVSDVYGVAPQERGTGRPSEAAGQGGSARPRAIGGFETARGSSYVVHEDGTTTRNKAARSDPGHEGDSGLKKRSEKTVFLDEQAARALAPPEGQWRVVDHGDGTLTLATRNDDGQWGAAPSARNIPYRDQPEVGAVPLELWRQDKVGDAPAWRGLHFGNKITRMLPADAAASAVRLDAPTPQAATNFKDHLRSVAQRSQDPEGVRLADSNASRAADAELSSLPGNQEQLLQNELDAARDRVEELTQALGLEEAVDQDLADADQAADLAEIYARAWDAAASCGTRRG